MTPILTSRTPIETSMRCPRLRYYLAEYCGVGLDLDRSAVALNVGSCVHAAAAAVLSQPVILQTGLDAAHAAPEWTDLATQEDRDLVDALVRTWWFAGLPTLQGWKILDVEREETFDYPVPPGTVRFQSRSDWIARAPEPVGRQIAQGVLGNTVGEAGGSDSILGSSSAPTLSINGLPVEPGLYNWNLKTWRVCDERRRNSLQYDSQVFTELLGPERRLEERFAGVIYQVLVKEDHPLVWAWYSQRRQHTASRFSWRCDASHENTHKSVPDLCPGGKFHKLGDDYERVAIRDLPGGQAAHFERLMEEDPTLLRDFHKVIVLRRPNDHVIQEWIEMWLPREVTLRSNADLVNAAVASGDDAEVERLLRAHFPKHTADGNCVKYARFLDTGEIIADKACPALGLCWGSQVPASFELKTTRNHPVLEAAQ